MSSNNFLADVIESAMVSAAYGLIFTTIAATLAVLGILAGLFWALNHLSIAVH